MRKNFAVFLVFVVLLTSCTSVPPPPFTPTNENPSTETIEVTMEEPISRSPTIQLQVTETTRLSPTIIPTAIPTTAPIFKPPPAVFNRAGYRQFALTRNYFPGLLAYAAERSYTVISTALSPDGNSVAISGCWGSMTNFGDCETRQSGFLIVLDTNSGELKADIPLGGNWPGYTAFSADSSRLLFSTAEHKVFLWDIPTNKSIQLLVSIPESGSTSYPDVDAAWDGQSYAALIRDTLYAWDASGNLLFQTPANLNGTSKFISFSANGSRLITFSSGRIGVDIYNTAGWSKVRHIETDKIRYAAISPDGRFLAILNQERDSASVWDVDTGEELALLNLEYSGYSIHFNPAGDLLIIPGMGSLEQQDDYSTIGALFDTTTWTKLDTMVSYSREGLIDFNRDGNRMMISDGGVPQVWALPDESLREGLDIVREFQTALSQGDYSTAAALFEYDEREAELFTEMGIDPDNLAASFEQLCKNETIFCRPIERLLVMGHDWDDMVYLVQLEGTDGKVFTSPNGAQIIYMYARIDKNGEPRVIYLPMDF